MSTQHHDALFRATFIHPEHAAGEIATMLPPELVARLDLSTVRALDGSFVDPDLQSRHTDLLFSVALRDGTGELFVYVLLEHQSTPDPWMPLRMLGYMLRIWERFREDHPKASLLPAIVPLVVSHDPAGWRAPVAMDALFALDEDAIRWVGPHLPQFRFLLDDLAITSDDALRGRAMTAMGRLVLGLLKHGRNLDQFVSELGRWARTFREVIGAPGGMAALAAVLRYMRLANDRMQAQEVADQLANVLGEGVKEAYMTEGERLIAEGLERGVEQGLKQGLARGLRHQLEKRFGALPEFALTRIENASVEELDRWALALLDAPDLDAVLRA